VPVTLRNSVSRREAGALPTLIVSPGPLESFRPLRGKVYQGSQVPKFEEIKRLRAAGVPVPRTAVLTPDLNLDPAEWGELVVLKPTDIPTSSRGKGINLVRTSRVRYKQPEEYPPDHPGRLGPMMVQQYIDTGEKLTGHRVLTFFGEPLCTHFSRSSAARVGPSASDEQIENAIVAMQAGGDRERILTIDEEVIALARRAHAALPEIPLKGCDIIREASSGRLYVLELNSGGNTWHFSSDFATHIRHYHGSEFVLRQRQQFDAMRTAARVLVDRVRSEAD
jgi:glutathione synthase/RimK-type ligase-like ATP-grasp enzyme